MPAAAGRPVLSLAFSRPTAGYTGSAVAGTVRFVIVNGLGCPHWRPDLVCTCGCSMPWEHLHIVRGGSHSDIGVCSEGCAIRACNEFGLSPLLAGAAPG